MSEELNTVLDENWKEIEGYDGKYLISDKGRVISRKHRFLYYLKQ